MHDQLQVEHIFQRFGLRMELATRLALFIAS